MSAIAAIHTGLRQLGIVEDDKRDLYERLTGKRSLTEMAPRDLESVVSELRRLGFKPSSKGASKRLEGKYAKKLQAQWIAMWNLGLTADRSDAALISFVRRQTKIDHTRFLRHPEDAAKVIEALKAWATREAGVDWSIGKHVPAWQRLPGAKVALAQWNLLEKAGVILVPATFQAFVESRCFNPMPTMTAREWVLIMNTFGERIRAAKKAALA